jgi:hypothetical protein
LLEMLRDGRLHLSGIARLAPHLTCQNAEAILRRASGMSHREIRELVAELAPRPDVAPSVRRLPARPEPGNGSPLPEHRNGSPLSGPGNGSLLQLGAPRVESGAVNLEPSVGARPARRSWSPSPPAGTRSASPPAPSFARSSSACRP